MEKVESRKQKVEIGNEAGATSPRPSPPLRGGEGEKGHGGSVRLLTSVATRGQKARSAGRENHAFWVKLTRESGDEGGTVAGVQHFGTEADVDIVACV